MPVIPKGYIITDKCCDKTRFYDTLADFPETGLVSRLYVDRSTGNIYVWDGMGYIPSGGPTPVFATNVAAFPLAGEVETIYIDESTGAVYIWDGVDYITADASANNGLRITTGNVVLGSDDETDPKDSELTTDSFIHLDGNKVSFVGTEFSNPAKFSITESGGLITEKTSAATGTPNTYVWKIKALTDTHNFNFSQASTNGGAGIYNNTFTFGWNLDVGGSIEEANKSGIGLSFEDNYEPIIGTDIAEYHTFFVTKAGVQHRLESFTINKDTPQLWERFSTLAVDYHKNPNTGYVWNTLSSNFTNGDLTHRYLSSTAAVATGVEHYVSPSQLLYYIRPVNFQTAANNIWQNTLDFGLFGRINTAAFTTIKYNGTVVFTFNDNLPVFADNATAILGGATTRTIYRTATGELRIVY